MNIPAEIQEFCQSNFGQVISFQPASGGCINHGGELTTSSGSFFIKWNSATRYPGMFTKEKMGLELLGQAGKIKVPQVEAVFDGSQYSCIVMDYIGSAPRSASYWPLLAEGLAAVHRLTADNYGLDHDNFMGSLVQYNQGYPGWVEFFVHSRLAPQVKLAMDHGRMNASHGKLFDALYSKLPGILVIEPPSLIHGDLWSGNIMVGEKGEPALIDPAVAFANREMDIAMTQLFGALPGEFYNAYNDIYPMEPNWQERLDLYNIYPLLVHVNLFGGGYLGQVMHILNKFV